MRLVMAFNRDDLNALDFPIIVEAWNKRLSGRAKRLWLSTFTQPERNKLDKLHTLFYGWYLRTGTPDEYLFRKGSTIDLIKRAVTFFATL